MKLYLVQHGKALAEEVDSQRSLSEEGLAEVRKVAGYGAEHCDMHPQKILHSGKRRAEQTADILSKALSIGTVEVADELKPMADPAIWASRCNSANKDLMLVGHLPHLAKLATLLLGGDPERPIIRFQMGGIVALHKENGSWELKWMIVPEII